jgi:polyvinyl alcohol dehydrogenase (cytochrome)
MSPNRRDVFGDLAQVHIRLSITEEISMKSRAGKSGTATACTRGLRTGRRLAVGLLLLSALFTASPGLPSAHAQVGAQSGDVANSMYDLRGSRHNAVENTITTQNVGRLRRKWAFAIPGVIGQSSQPAVVGDTVYFGAENGLFYALNASNGHTRWRFNTLVRSVATLTGPGNPLRDSPAVADGRVYFGDSRGFLYALDARTGGFRWKTRLSRHPATVITSPPIVFEGKVFIGVSSHEEGLAGITTYPCCTFRGSFVALDAQSGRIRWRYYTIEKPRRHGVTNFLTPVFKPSGAPVWSGPAIDPNTHTVFFGTGNNYSGISDRQEAIVALSTDSGELKWFRQMRKSDAWTTQCALVPGVGSCPDPGPDYDFGAQANLFNVGGRTVVGIGQKSGVYHVLDARTGDVVWRAQVATPSGDPKALGHEGIQWGSSYDGNRVYVATSKAKPGTLFALNPTDGSVDWRTPLPTNTCKTGGAKFAVYPGECNAALSAPVSSTPGLVWAGGMDGKLRAYSSATGKQLWSYDTVRPYLGVNGIAGVGGSIDLGGPVIAHGMVYTNSGYTQWAIPLTEMPGNVLLAFALPK